MNHSNAKTTKRQNPGDVASRIPGILLERFKKGDSAGSKGVDFQIGLLTVALLNAFKYLKRWRLSTENCGAGKFDDLVLESPDGDVLLQAKQIENRHKTVTLKEFMSTDSNGNFSLPKYFGSYVQDIKGKFQTTNIIICTNAAVDDDVKPFLEPINDLSKSILCFPGATCCFYRFKQTVVEDLKMKIPIYYQNQSKIKYNANQTTDQSIKEFLDKLQICCNYPSGETMEKVVEQILSRSIYSKSPYGQVSQLEISAKVKAWFQQKGKVCYLNDILTKAMFFDIWKDKYFKMLSQYNISFQNNALPYLEPRGIFHFVTDGTYLSEELRLFEEFKVHAKNVLYLPSDINTEIQQEIIEIFKLNQYNYLLIIFPKTSVGKVYEPLRQIVNNSKDKRAIVMSDLTQTIPYQRIFFTSFFKQISPLCQQALLNKEIVNFQGHHLTLKALLGSAASNAVEEIDLEILDRLIKNEEIRVGLEITPLEPDLSSYYINREFIRKGVVLTEDSIFDITEKIILISDGAGNGKTTVLKKLSSIIKEKYPHFWIIRIELNDYSHKFRKLLAQQENINIAQLLEFNYVEKLAFSTEEKVVLMVDAVDEISPDYKDIILNLLRKCKQAPNFKKIFITTRPHITEELEEVLEVDEFKLQSFTERNQIEFLKKYWAYNLELTEDLVEDCGRYATLLLKKTALWMKTYSDNTFAVIPLQVKMLGEIFQENDGGNESQNWQGCKEYLSADNEEPGVPEMNIAQLYRMFVEKKRYIFINKGNPCGNPAAIDALNSRFDEFLKYHENLALELLFGKTICKLFTTYKVNETTAEHVLKMGIIQKVDNKITFVHRTFAEYYAATRLVVELQNPNKSDNLQKYFTKHVLGDNVFNVVRAFIENILKSTEYSSATNIFKTNRFPWFGVPIESNLIHILAREDLVNILRLLLDHLDFKIITGKEINVSSGSIYPFSKTLEHLKALLRKAGLNIKDIIGKTPLHYAAESGHVKMAEFLVEKGANVNSLDNLNESPLHSALEEGHIDMANFLVEKGAITDTPWQDLLFAAVQRGRLDTVMFLIEKGVDVSSLEERDVSLLHVAIEKGHLNVVKYLIENGADIDLLQEICYSSFHSISMNEKFNTDTEFAQGANINCFSQKRNSPLHYAAEKGQVAIAKLFVERGANINNLNEKGNSPLHFAAVMRQFEMVKFLVENGAKVNQINNEINSPIHFAAEKGHLGIVKFLIDHGGNFNALNTTRNTPLHLASRKGHLEVVKFLVKQGANIHSSHAAENLPLHYASNHLEVAKFLIEKGADVNSLGENDESPLHSAARSGELTVVKFLLEKGANMNSLNKFSELPIHYAALGGNLDVVQFFIDQGVDVNSLNIEGNSPFHMAARGGHLDIAKLLVEKGAKVNSLNQKRTSPLHYAVYTNLDFVKFLMQKEACVDILNDKMNSPLHLASDTGLFDIVKHLITQGANIDALNENHCSPLHLASMNGHLDIAELLIQMGADIDRLDNNNISPLNYACADGSLAVGKMLVEKGADVKDALHFASMNGNLDVIKFLIQNGISVNSLDGRNYTPLHVAALKGHLDASKYLIQQGAIVNRPSEEGNTPLHAAAEGGSLEVVEYLIEKKVNVNCLNDNKYSPLHCACIHGHLDVVELLMQNGADINSLDNKKNSVLHSAAARNHLNVVKFLVQNQVCVNILNDKMHSPLHLASGPDQLDIARYLVAQGANVNSLDKTHNTPIHYAAGKGNLGMVRLLIEKGADITDALHCASKNGHLNVMEFLIEHEVPIDRLDKYDSTPLCLTAANGPLEALELLIDQGANINSSNEGGDTPLHAAVVRNDFKIVKYLIEKGANVNGLNGNKFSALHYACMKGAVDIAELLIQKGADVNCLDEKNNSPLYYACRNNQLDVVELLVIKGADVNSFNEINNTSLHCAVFNGNMDVMEFLITNGAVVDSINEYNDTPLHFAAGRGHVQAAKSLIQHGANIESLNIDGNTPLHYAVSDPYMETIGCLIEQGANVNSLNYAHNTPLHFASFWGVLGAIEMLVEAGANVNALNLNGNAPVHVAYQKGHLDIVALLFEKGAGATSLSKNEESPLSSAFDLKVEGLSENGEAQ